MTTPRAPGLSRGDAAEALAGLLGMLACIGIRFGALIAIFVASAALFVFGLWGRRIISWGRSD